ncbi:DUF2061 domain-containing protein [Mangrovimicrobium sediminis]|uniref:DUF2061 domain-containing protein n=1 Tax=Mangrovimicrobium sediminis TaxID=2562682 RepID=A0A4Z0LZY9_9GAMM|nr:DUF2061 domain-containing protein [Haliea sp. SAOS-164]
MKKTMSFAAIHMGVAFSVGYAMTGDVLVGGAMALVEPACNTVAFYFHEKLWSRMPQVRATRADTPALCA